MKRLRCLLIGLALLAYIDSRAQDTSPPAPTEKSQKPLLFADLPAYFEVNKAELQKIFSTEPGQPIKLQLSPQLVIEGKVVDKNQHNPASVSVNIRVANYHNALFNTSVKFNADNSTSIQGRILHPRYGDVLQLYKDQDKYFIKKNSQALFMPE